MGSLKINCDIISMKEKTDFLQLCKQEAQQTTTSPKVEPMEAEKKDKMRTRPRSAHYIRGPPLSKPQVAQVSCGAMPTLTVASC